MADVMSYAVYQLGNSGRHSPVLCIVCLSVMPGFHHSVAVDPAVAVLRECVTTEMLETSFRIYIVT